MKFEEERIAKKYMHIGFSYPAVPDGWRPIVIDAIKKIEKNMWPQWIPFFIKRWIHYLATGNSVVFIKNNFFYWIRKKLTKGQIVFDIKEKLATLRIYSTGIFDQNIEKIIKEAEDECDKTCQICGSKDDVQVVGGRWIENICRKCRLKKGGK